MADITKMTPAVRREARELFSSHSGEVYVCVWESQDRAIEWWDIQTADAATVANFNEAPIGSKLFDRSDGSYHLKTGASTWVTVDVT